MCLLVQLVPVYVFVRSFVFTCSFGRENDVRSEQALQNGSVALECMHMYSWGQRESVALEFVISGSKLQILWPAKFGQFPKIVRNDYFETDVRTYNFFFTWLKKSFKWCKRLNSSPSTYRYNSMCSCWNIYRGLCELLVATFRIFEQFDHEFDWAPRNQNYKTDMEL